MVTRATFKSFEESTKEEWANIMVCLQETQAMVSTRIIEQMKMLEHDQGGFPVNRLEHCLQTATLAHQDGKDEEYVVCALLHDIGDTLGPASEITADRRQTGFINRPRSHISGSRWRQDTRGNDRALTAPDSQQSAGSAQRLRR